MTRDEFDLYQRQHEAQSLHSHLSPALVEEDEVVRNVPRAVGALPCRSSEKVVGALRHYVLEMTFPLDAPPWAPEETIS